MFNVNYKTVSMGLIAVLISAQASAQAVRPRERVQDATRTREAVSQAPSTKAGDAIVNGFKDAPKGRPAAAVNFLDEKGNTCNAETYASKLVNGTSVSYADGLALVKAGFVKMGMCGVEEGALLGYSADARETLLLALSQLSKSVNGRSFLQLSIVERVQAKTVLAEALATAKNRHGGNKFTAASELATVDKISASKDAGGCELVPKM